MNGYVYIKLTNVEANGGGDLWVNMARVEGMLRKENKTLLYLQGDAGECFFAVHETPEEIKDILQSQPESKIIF